MYYLPCKEINKLVEKFTNRELKTIRITSEFSERNLSKEKFLTKNLKELKEITLLLVNKKGKESFEHVKIPNIEYNPTFARIN